MQYLTPEDYQRAEQNGINRKMLHFRFYHEKWSLERATTEIPKRRTSRKKQNGYEEYREICEANGISYSIYANRIRKGWEKERAALTPVVDKQTRIELMLQARGVRA